MSEGLQRVSNDNPYSEAQFKTPRYHPGFPGRFADIEEAKDFRRTFQWVQHRTPPRRYRPAHAPAGPPRPRPRGDRAPAEKVLTAAYAARPDRFAGGPPKVAELPDEVWINRALPITSANAAGPAAARETEGSQTESESVSQSLAGSDAQLLSSCHLLAGHAA